MSKKVVVKLDMRDGRAKRKAIKAVSALLCVDAISVDMASQTMTVTGMVDPVKVVSKLRKASCSATMVLVGPAKEPEKEEKKDGDAAKKEGDGEKKDGNAAKKDSDDANKVTAPTEQQIIAELMNQYWAYNLYYMTPHYYVQSTEENPNPCAIC